MEGDSGKYGFAPWPLLGTVLQLSIGLKVLGMLQNFRQYSDFTLKGGTTSKGVHDDDKEEGEQQQKDERRGTMRGFVIFYLVVSLSHVAQGAFDRATCLLSKPEQFGLPR